MEKITGKILDITIPKEFINGQAVDVMYRTNIKFKVQTENGIEFVELPQDEDNIKILIGDEVLITKQTISGHDFTDIEKME